MSFRTILQTYAKASPEALPAAILFKHSEKNITIFDAYPKSKFHFLILPRVLPDSELPLSALETLQTLVRVDREKAKRVIASLAEDAKGVKEDIQNEMIRYYGFKWDVWTGFHAHPSMLHLHLHVLSADLVSDKMKHKKHYNSFNPEVGFLITLDDVISWFDAEPSFYKNVVMRFNPKEYEERLKEDLICFHCNREMKNMPILKTHLKDVWDKLERESAKRKLVFEKLQGRSKAHPIPLDNDDESKAKETKETTPV